MPDPLALVPLPQSVVWSEGTWETSDPWEGLSVGLNDSLPATEYALSISPTGASLSAGSEAALADGRNTFAQIVTGANGSIPCVSISDRPKFAWRGMHLDVARHFLPLEEIETLVDAMALHRLNILHLHSPQSAITSAIIFNALVIVALIPLALRGVRYKPSSAAAMLRKNLWIYGVGGLIIPFAGIKLIDMIIQYIPGFR